MNGGETMASDPVVVGEKDLATCLLQDQHRFRKRLQGLARLRGEDAEAGRRQLADAIAASQRIVLSRSSRKKRLVQRLPSKRHAPPHSAAFRSVATGNHANSPR